VKPWIGGAFFLAAGVYWLLGRGYVRARQATLAPLGTRAKCGQYSGLPPAWGSDERAGMVWVEGGSFVPGSGEGYADERPAEPAPRVAVPGFWIDRSEVTNAQFTAFIAATRYVTLAEREGASAVFHVPSEAELAARALAWWRREAGASWRHPDGPASDLRGRANHPVVHIAYADALAYARWLGRALPSEDQWEYAARAGVRSDALDREPVGRAGAALANFWQGLFPVQNEVRDGFAAQAPVGCYPANRYGLHDMIGNVWEWTRDPYRARAELAPMGALHTAAGCHAAGSEGQLVIKGGSFLCSANFCARYRVAARHAHEPSTPTAHLGFRTVSAD
jgi:sulfatase modifying factor 1